MGKFDRYLDKQLSCGRAWFNRDEGLRELGMSPEAFTAAATRLLKKRRLVSPKRGFFLILRPEDWNAGAPDPASWIDMFMRCQGIDYRISLLRAAAFHGSSHNAAMVFQVITPRQLRNIELGRHRVQFVYQAPNAFEAVNRPGLLGQIKSDSGFAKVSGVELTLLDVTRYLRKAAGINNVAQIVKDLGAKASPRKLGIAAAHYENAALMRLGFLLDHAGHTRQSRALESFVRHAKSMKPLDPSIMPLSLAFAADYPKDSKWKIIINEQLEDEF